MAWLREIGLLDREHRRWIPRKPECGSGGRGFVTVGLTEINPAIILLIAGNAISVAIFLTEKIIKWILNQYKNPK